MKGELVKGQSIHVDYSPEERINTVLIMEKNVNSNVKGSCQRKGTCGSLTVASLEMSFRIIIPYT